MNNIQYFSHDVNSLGDAKLQEVFMEMGMEGVGLYWCLVEIMYKQEGKLRLDKCERYAFTLRTHLEKINKLIELVFESDKTHFWSNGVLKRIDLISEKSQKARESAQARWSERNANALRTQSEGNAIKESKVKEKKEYKESFSKFIEKFNLLFNSKYRVTDGRYKKYISRRASFSEKEVLLALGNLSMSGFHVGNNERGWVASPDFLLRSDEKVDEWLNKESEDTKKFKEVEIKS